MGLNRGRCFIVGSGDFTARGLRPLHQDLLLAADGGADALAAIGLHPALVIGDMDSLHQAPSRLPTLRFPRAKADTDIVLCVRFGLARGFRRFLIYGASGSRPDHFFANLQLLSALSAKRLQASIVAPGFSAHVVTNSCLMLSGQRTGARVSVFSLSQVSTGVTLIGLVYPLDEGKLRADFPVGVSNQAMSERVFLQVRKGSLLVFVEEGEGFQEPFSECTPAPISD